MHAKLKEKTRRASTKLLLATSKFEHLSECATNPSHSASFLLTRSPLPAQSEQQRNRQKRGGRKEAESEAYGSRRRAICIAVNLAISFTFGCLLVCSSVLTHEEHRTFSASAISAPMYVSCPADRSRARALPRVICCARGWNRWALSSCFPRACCRRVMALEPSAAAGPSSSPRTPTCGRRRRP